MARITQKLVKSRNITEVQQPTCARESVEKFMIAQIGCIDVVQLVDYAALDCRRNFKEEIAISERPNSFDGTHCATYCLVQNEWRKLEEQKHFMQTC